MVDGGWKLSNTLLRFESKSAEVALPFSTSRSASSLVLPRFCVPAEPSE